MWPILLCQVKREDVLLLHLKPLLWPYFNDNKKFGESSWQAQENGILGYADLRTK